MKGLTVIAALVVLIVASYYLPGDEPDEATTTTTVQVERGPDADQAWLMCEEFVGRELGTFDSPYVGMSDEELADRATNRDDLWTVMGYSDLPGERVEWTCQATVDGDRWTLEKLVLR